MLFIYNHSAACYWYNTSLDRQDSFVDLFRSAGWLAGQSIHNRACLGIKLAAVLWRKVLEGDGFQASSFPEAKTVLLGRVLRCLTQARLHMGVCDSLQVTLGTILWPKQTRH